MRELIAELKDLRLHGMASAWADLTAQGSSGVESSRWLLEHLLSAEATDRAMRGDLVFRADCRALKPG